MMLLLLGPNRHTIEQHPSKDKNSLTQPLLSTLCLRYGYIFEILLQRRVRIVFLIANHNCLLYQLSVTALTNYQKLGGFNNKSIPSQFRGQKSKFKVLARPHALRRLQMVIPSMPFSWFLVATATFAIPWIMVAFIPISASVITLMSSLCVSPLCVSFKDTCHCIEGHAWIFQDDLL